LHPLGSILEFQGDIMSSFPIKPSFPGTPKTYSKDLLSEAVRVSFGSETVILGVFGILLREMIA
jgi:hypothetical protein